MYRKKGQSILEYVIVLSAIVAAIVLAASTVIKPGIGNALKGTMDTINSSASRIQNLQ